MVYIFMTFSQYTVFFAALQRHNTENSKLIFPEKELRLGPDFHIHVSVSALYIPTIGLPILLQENMWTDTGNICIYIAHRQMNGEIETEAVQFLFWEYTNK
jgi:hypothetical protein